MFKKLFSLSLKCTDWNQKEQKEYKTVSLQFSCSYYNTFWSLFIFIYKNYVRYNTGLYIYIYIYIYITNNQVVMFSGKCIWGMIDISVITISLVNDCLLLSYKRRLICTHALRIQRTKLIEFEDQQFLVDFFITA